MPCLQFIIIISENKEIRETGKEGKLFLQKEIENYMFCVCRLAHVIDTIAYMKYSVP